MQCRIPAANDPRKAALTLNARSQNMETRKLGNSDLQITPVGYGAWAIGGSGWDFAWGHQEDADSIAAIHRSLELGVNWIDTAAVYGIGHSEEMVAQALKDWRGPRPHVFTKCVLRWDDQGHITQNHTAVSIRRECEDSLRRLQIEVIDLYQMHWPPSDNGPGLEEAWQTMATLQEEGKVRWIGVSNFNVEQIKRAEKIAPVTSLQPPYSLLNRNAETEILPYCRKQNIGVINYSPMASGMLTGKMSVERIQNLPADDWRKRSPNFKEPKLSRNLKLVELLKEIGDTRGVEPGVIATAWTLANSAITAAIVGARSPEQVKGTIAAASFTLNPAEIAKIG